MNTRKSKPSPVRVGLIGTGWVGTERHIPAFQKDPRARIVALYDSDKLKASETARRFRIPSVCDNLEAFLDIPLDIVSICTPPRFHAPLVAQALRAGKHVLVEKPMTLTTAEGRDLETQAHERDLILSPSHNFLFSRSMSKAKALLANGNSGEIKWVNGIQMSSWRRRLPTWFEGLPGGLFFDEAPHLLYLMRFLLGNLNVEEAWSNKPENAHNHLERIEARLSGAHGGAHLSMWFGAPLSEWLLVIFCTKEVLVVDLFRDILLRLPPEKAHDSRDVLRIVLTGTYQLWQGMITSGLSFFRHKLLYGHDLLIKRMLDAVIDGKEPPQTARDGWEIISLMENILDRSGDLNY